MFMSFKSQDAETRYSISKRECLAIVRCLSEVRWLIMGSKYPAIVNTDHEALASTFATGRTEKGRVATWVDRLGEFDLLLRHRPSKDQHIGVGDALSRMPIRLTETSMVIETERIRFAVEEETGSKPPDETNSEQAFVGLILRSETNAEQSTLESTDLYVSLALAAGERTAYAFPSDPRQDGSGRNGMSSSCRSVFFDSPRRRPWIASSGN